MIKADCYCCGARGTVEEEALGMFGRCKRCGWEDDGVQHRYPDEEGSNDRWTLNLAKEAWARGETLFPRYPHP